MGHKVGVAAERAVKNSQKKDTVELTPEQRLKEIRKNREAKLFITPQDQDFLLAEYDRVIALNVVLTAQLQKLTEENEQFRTVYEQENSSRGTLTIVAEAPVAAVPGTAAGADSQV